MEINDESHTDSGQDDAINSSRDDDELKQDQESFDHFENVDEIEPELMRLHDQDDSCPTSTALDHPMGDDITQSRGHLSDSDKINMVPDFAGMPSDYDEEEGADFEKKDAEEKLNFEESNLALEKKPIIDDGDDNGNSIDDFQTDDHEESKSPLNKPAITPVTEEEALEDLEVAQNDQEHELEGDHSELDNQEGSQSELDTFQANDDVQNYNDDVQNNGDDNDVALCGSEDVFAELNDETKHLDVDAEDVDTIVDAATAAEIDITAANNATILAESDTTATTEAIAIANADATSDTNAVDVEAAETPIASRRSSRSKRLHSSRTSRKSGEGSTEGRGEGCEIGSDGMGERRESLKVRPSRAELLERYQQALADRHQLQLHNSSLQHRLSDCLRRKKVDDLQIDDRSTMEQEQRYLKYMASLDDLRREERESSEAYRQTISEMESLCGMKQNEVQEQDNILNEMIRNFALSAPSSSTGKPLPEKVYEGLIEGGRRRESEVYRVRLQNIKLKNQLNKHMSMLRSKEELAEGLHMIDFEQLKIENQTYNEKIEERNEELLRLKKKITTTVEVLSHVKEKLQFIEAQNEGDRLRLQILDQQASAKRDEVSHSKRARDSLRANNYKLRQTAGLLTNHMLLSDYEHKVDECMSMSQQLQNLQNRRQEISRIVSSTNNRRKINT